MERDLFRTVDGTAVPAVTAEEMREVDRVAVETVGLELLQMMENAGRTLARQTRAVGDGPVTVVAGNGGNGGGGLCCARHLANRGVAVTVVLDRQPGELDGAAAHQRSILDATDVSVRAAGDGVPASSGVLVDSLVGYGLSGPVRGSAAGLVEEMNAADAPTVSLDVPTGRDATTGEVHGDTVAPDRIVTLAVPKTGLRSVDAALVLADIGIPKGVYERVGIPSESPFDRQYAVALEQVGEG